MKIIGAGLAGLLAAHAWPQAELFEAQSGPRAEHKALLRFRGTEVSKLIGIEFKQVTVRKGIYFDGAFSEPTINLANWYSSKVLGRIVGERSVWSLEPAQRFIAPENLYEQLVETVGARIHWGVAHDFSEREPIINTAPLPVALKALGIENGLHFLRAAIRVERYRVAGAEVHQTIYFPAPELPVYRASITGDLMIVESVSDRGAGRSMEEVVEAFGLVQDQLSPLDSTDQKYGKILPLEDSVRKAVLHRLTREFNVFSLGRFATWRNVLLDDVVQDIAVVRRLMRATGYEKALFASN